MTRKQHLEILSHLEKAAELIGSDGPDDLKDDVTAAKNKVLALLVEDVSNAAACTFTNRTKN